MGFQIFVAYPPDQEGRVAQLCEQRDGGIAIPVEVYDEKGERKIRIFTPTGDVGWEYRLDDFRTAVDDAIAALDAPPSRPTTTP